MGGLPREIRGRPLETLDLPVYFLLEPLFAQAKKGSHMYAGGTTGCLATTLLATRMRLAATQ